MAAILPVSWKKSGSHGYGRLISEFTIPLQSNMISVVRVAYRRETLKFAWQAKTPYIEINKTNTTKPIIVPLGINSPAITAPTANRK